MEVFDKDLEKLVEKAFKFSTEKIYNRFLAYFDVVGQVHSVVQTEKNNEILRIWCGKTVDKIDILENKLRKVFRATQATFKKYIVEPDLSIANTIREIGVYGLLEIDVYDENKQILPYLKSGDFVVVTNVHYASFRGIEVFILHGNGQKFNRGIKRIPLDFPFPKFFEFKKKIEDRISSTKLSGPYVEFVQEDLSGFSKTNADKMSSKRIFTKKIVDFELSTIPANELIRPCRSIVLANNLISVDYFSKKKPAKYHFLTHAHSDHCRGLDHKWTHLVYCSEKTAAVAPLVTGKRECDGVLSDQLKVLEINKKHEFNEFNVTLLDANHCPGAVMFLFDGEAFPDGPILCTGDFRADQNFLKQFETNVLFQNLRKNRLKNVYFDNTYLHIDATIPPKDEAIKIFLEILKKKEERNIYIPLHKLGREEMLEKLSEELNEPIQVYEKKRKVIDELGFYTYYGVKTKRNLMVVEKSSWREKEAVGNYLIFDVSMINSDKSINNQLNKSRTIHIPFSDHSSRIEILEFFRMLNFANLTPISRPMRGEVKNFLLSFSTDTKNQEHFIHREFAENLEEIEVEEETTAMAPTTKKRTEIEKNREDPEEAEIIAKRYCPEGWEIVNELPQPKSKKEAIQWIFHTPEYRLKQIV